MTVASSGGEPFYYLINFQAMLDTLADRDGELLAADEREFIERFPTVPVRSRALLTRLIMRKGALFRASRLRYAEIGELRSAVGALVEAGWLEDQPLLELDELFHLLTKAELVQLLGLSRRGLALPKQELLALAKQDRLMPPGRDLLAPLGQDGSAPPGREERASPAPPRRDGVAPPGRDGLAPPGREGHASLAPHEQQELASRGQDGGGGSNAAGPPPRSFGAWTRGAEDSAYRVTIDELCRRLRAMFFGNFRQDLSEFVLADLKIFRYERVDLRADSRPFRTRRHVEHFHQLFACREMLHAGVPPADIEARLPERIADCAWLDERREKLRFQIGGAHERGGDAARALAIYATCRYREAPARAQRLSARLQGCQAPRAARRDVEIPHFELALPRPGHGSVERAADGWVQGAAPPPVPGSVERAAPDAAERVALDWVQRAADGWVQGPPPPAHGSAERAAHGLVERAVLRHLSAAAEHSSVRYVENGLINSLFGLLCWPAIFAPVAGAFFHAFHHGPADLASPAFRQRREREFEACLAQLEDGSYRDAMRRRWREKAGVSSPFVAWGLVDEALLEVALACFPPLHLRRWFEWIAQDVTVNRSGFPDLVQFWPAEKRYRLIEVKGPGDRLQDNQRRCLEFCLTHGMPVAVCRVRWTTSLAIPRTTAISTTPAIPTSLTNPVSLPSSAAANQPATAA